MADKTRPDLLHGALEMLVLKLLEREPMNGYAVGQRIRDLTGDRLIVEEGSLYPALYRMERRGWLVSKWGRSENNRRAKFYRITRSGRKQLGAERAAWADFAESVRSILESA
jgi:transcriptional regulator